MLRILLAPLVFAASTGSITAQSFDEVFAAAQNNVGDIAKYQEALQNPDQRFQYAMVQQMLKLPDPALQRIAKEHALFSNNPVMREAAIKAILDSGAVIRLQVAGNGEETKNIGSFVLKQGGSFVSGQGDVLITTPEAVNDSCWGSSRGCLYKQVGNTLQYTPGGSITAVLTLGNDGVMRGNMNYAFNSVRETAQVQIDLKQ